MDVNTHQEDNGDVIVPLNSDGDAEKYFMNSSERLN